MTFCPARRILGIIFYWLSLYAGAHASVISIAPGHQLTLDQWVEVERLRSTQPHLSAGLGEFYLNLTTACPGVPAGAGCGTANLLLDAARKASPELNRVAPERTGPGKVSVTPVRTMNRVLHQPASRNAEVMVRLGSDQLLLDFERSRATVDAVPIEEKAPSWATLTVALMVGSLVFARSPDRTVMPPVIQHWSRPPPVCCWAGDQNDALQLCGDPGSGHRWPGHWRCGGTCPPHPETTRPLLP